MLMEISNRQLVMWLLLNLGERSARDSNPGSISLYVAVKALRVGEVTQEEYVIGKYRGKRWEKKVHSPHK